MPVTASRNQTRRETRRTELVDAALSLFMANGVATTSVDDIVQAAGAAKGTFYLYFSTRDDVVNAVAERIVDGVGARFEAVAAVPNLSPVDRLLALGSSVSDVGVDERERELIEVFHRPENRAIHDRFSERIAGRLLPTVESIIEDGITAGLFAAQDPHLAAAFVLATFNSLHDLVTGEPDLGHLTSELSAFLLRGLGYAGEVVR